MSSSRRSCNFQSNMKFLKIALFLCVVIGSLERAFAVTNECVGPPRPYSNSVYKRCVPNQPTGGCNCTDPGETCSHGDQLEYECDHGIDLDFIIVCDYKDMHGNLGFISLQDSRDEFEACTGSPAPVQSTPPPLPTFPPSDCSKFNVATWPPEGCIRLVENQTMPHETTGVLQVYFNTTWGSVCHTSTWNQPTMVDIACRMLGFNNHGSPAVQLDLNHLPLGFSRDAWTVNIQHTCSGTVTSLWDCERTNEPCWLTYAEGGSGECPNLLQISCEVNTTFPDLMSCQPPKTTTSGPDIFTHPTEERTAAPGHDASHTAGLSTGGIVGIVVAVVVAVLLVAGIWWYKRCRSQAVSGQGQTQQQSVGEKSVSNKVKDGTSGTTANQASTDRDSNQSTSKPSTTKPAGQSDSPPRTGSDLTPISS